MKSVRKKKIAIIAFLVLVEVTSVFLMYKASSDNKTILDDVMLNDNGILKEDMFAIMLEQEDGTYKESDDNTWPTSGYSYDSTRSGCIDSKGNRLEGILSYDATNNIATVETGDTAFCYLYFSFPLPDIKVTNVDLAKLNTGKYIKSLDCGSTGSATFNTKYQRIEFGSITVPAECSMNYTEDAATYPTLKSVVESKATTNANGYRYSGKTPNNYIWFNNEMWRIIGSIPTCTSSGCATSENLVKIIRAESIGGLAYDAKSSGYTGAWGSNTLYTLLNDYYYDGDNDGNLNGTGTSYCSGNSTTAKADCDYSKTGISTSSYYGQMIKNVYWNTGASGYSVAAGVAYTNETATQTVSGHIGLMSASDYGYAADSGYHSTSMGSYNTAAITGTNWLYGQGYEWTNIQHSGNTNNALNVNNNGRVYNVNAHYGYSIRPVLYLDSSVYVISGEGTKASPYMIGM